MCSPCHLCAQINHRLYSHVIKKKKLKYYLKNQHFIVTMVKIQCFNEFSNKSYFNQVNEDNCKIIYPSETPLESKSPYSWIQLSSVRVPRLQKG